MQEITHPQYFSIYKNYKRISISSVLPEKMWTLSVAAARVCDTCSELATYCVRFWGQESQIGACLQALCSQIPKVNINSFYWVEFFSSAVMQFLKVFFFLQMVIFFSATLFNWGCLLPSPPRYFSLLVYLALLLSSDVLFVHSGVRMAITKRIGGSERMSGTASLGASLG